MPDKMEPTRLLLVAHWIQGGRASAAVPRVIDQISIKIFLVRRLNDLAQDFAIA